MCKVSNHDYQEDESMQDCRIGEYVCMYITAAKEQLSGLAVSGYL